MATAADITAIITEIQSGADVILKTIETVDPGVALPAQEAEMVTDLIAILINKALSAWSAASGVPITVQSVQALYANAIPLTPPTS